jgi:hypothetical protein
MGSYLEHVSSGSFCVVSQGTCNLEARAEAASGCVSVRSGVASLTLSVEVDIAS